MWQIKVLSLICLLQMKLVALQKSLSTENSSYYNIGGVLSTNESESHFSTTIAVSIFLYYLYTL